MNNFLTICAVCLILWAGSFIYFRLFLSKKTSSDRILSELREEVEKLVSEVDLATDRDVTLVEDRIKALRTLLDEADKRIATMRREADRRSSEEQAYSELGRRATSLRMEDSRTNVGKPLTLFPDEPAAKAEASGATYAKPSRELAPPASAPPVAPTRASAPQPAAAQSVAPRFTRSAAPFAPKAAPFFERVTELHRAGFSADLIAKRLGTTIGEVDLAISLSGKMDERDGYSSGN